MHSETTTRLRTQVGRFLVAGGLNTLLTYAVYLALLYAMAPLYAYAASYALGIVVSYALNARWVFDGQWTLRGLASFPVVHAVQALVSFGLFDLLTRKFAFPAIYAPLVVIAVTVPLTFLLARRVVTTTSAPRDNPDGQWK